MAYTVMFKLFLTDIFYLFSKLFREGDCITFLKNL